MSTTRRSSADTFARLYERPLPYALEAEAALIGAVILDPHTLADVLAIIDGPGDFYSESHAAVFGAIVEVWRDDPDADLVHVTDKLRARGVLEQVGGRDGLLRFAQETPSAAGAQSYARLVADKAQLRRLIDAGDRMIHDAMHSGGAESASEIVERAEAAVFAVSESRRARQESETMGDLMQHEAEQAKRRDGEARGVQTGFLDLDRMTLGLHPGQMVVLAARPSMGKSALAAQIALNAAKAGTRTLLHSLEMDRRSVAQRFIATESGVDMQRIRKGSMPPDMVAAVTATCRDLEPLPLDVDDTAGMTVFGLRAGARRRVARQGLGLIIVDYVQLMTAPDSSGESRQVEVSAISRGLKALARECNVPVVAVAQLNRQAEARTGNRPRMSDLRESGSLEMDADVVLLLYREGYYHQDEPGWAEANPDKVGTAELIIAKQRNGPTGTVHLTWDAPRVCFRNWTHDRAVSGPIHQPSVWGELPDGLPT